MTRKRIWFYNLFFLAGLSVMLTVINPAIAGAPVGFTFLFLAGLAVVQLVDWALSKVIAAHKWVVGVPAVVGLFFLFTGLAHAAWGVLAVLLVIVALSTQRPRKVPVVIPPQGVEGAARHVA